MIERLKGMSFCELDALTNAAARLAAIDNCFITLAAYFAGDDMAMRRQIAEALVAAMVDAVASLRDVA